VGFFCDAAIQRLSGEAGRTDDEVGTALPVVYNESAKPFVWTKAEVHQRRFKGRRISQLCFRVLARTEESDGRMLSGLRF
jgi:hypothetical protein